jgi:flavodoxin I
MCFNFFLKNGSQALQENDEWIISRKVFTKMKALIIYDSMFGNTEKIAQAIGDGLTGDVKVVRVGDVRPSELRTSDLFIFGSPVHGGRATPAIDTFVKQLPTNFIEGKSVAAFDTRFESEEKGIGLRLLMSVIHYAAPRLAKALVKKGGILVAEPEGFIVENKEGPLKQGELERASKWAKQMSIAKEVPFGPSSIF